MYESELIVPLGINSDIMIPFCSQNSVAITLKFFELLLFSYLSGTTSSILTFLAYSDELKSPLQSSTLFKKKLSMWFSSRTSWIVISLCFFIETPNVLKTHMTKFEKETL